MGCQGIVYVVSREDVDEARAMDASSCHRMVQELGRPSPRQIEENKETFCSTEKDEAGMEW